MLAASLRRERQFAVLSATMAPRVPRRCLFGAPNPKDTAEMLQEALEVERLKFLRRWGVDPREDKENLVRRPERNERSPRARNLPYSKQTNIHDYWRSRKLCDVNKKSTSSTSASESTALQQQPQHQQNVGKATSIDRDA